MRRTIALFLLVLASLHGSPPAAAAEPAPTVTEARAALDAALADPRFDRWRRDRTLDNAESSLADSALADRLRGWIDGRMEGFRRSVKDFFDWLFNRNSPPSTPTSPGSEVDWLSLMSALKWLGIGVCVLVIAALAWVAVLALRQRRPRRRRPPAPAALAAALQRGGALEAEADEWIDHAAGLAESGEDLRLAYRAMYLALLAGLHRRGWIRFAASRTNGAYVRGFRGPSAETGPGADGPRASFARLTALFDDAWYGHREPDRVGFPEVRAEVERLLAEEEK